MMTKFLYPVLLMLRIYRSTSTKMVRAIVNIVVPQLSLVPLRRLKTAECYVLPAERKPWLWPEKLINDLSDETSAHHRISLFDARRLHGLDISASNFRAKEDFCPDAFLKR